MAWVPPLAYNYHQYIFLNIETELGCMKNVTNLNKTSLFGSCCDENLMQCYCAVFKDAPNLIPSHFAKIDRFDQDILVILDYHRPSFQWINFSREFLCFLRIHSLSFHSFAIF